MRLTPSQLAEHQSWLLEWREPVSMLTYVEAINDQMGSEDFFRQGGTTFLRDAWTAASFGIARCSEAVRLLRRWPDFEIRHEQRDESFELIEADLPARKRGDEFRIAAANRELGAKSIVDDPVEEWEARARQIPRALSNAVAKKVAKNYGTRSSLLIHLNISEFGIRQAEIVASLPSLVAPGLPHFSMIWILWKGVAYGPWRTVAD